MCDSTKFARFSSVFTVFSRVRHTPSSCSYAWGHQTLVLFPELENQWAETSAAHKIWVLPAMLSLFTSFYSFQHQQAWPERCAKPEDCGQTRPGSNGRRTTGAPSKCHSCLKLAHSFPLPVMPTPRQQKDQMCLYTQRKNTHVFSVYGKTLWMGIYINYKYWQTICIFSSSILCGHGTLRSQHLLPNPD